MASMQTIRKRHRRSKSEESSYAPRLKKVKIKDPMALFCVVNMDNRTTGYFVSLRLLPPISQVKQDLNERGTAKSRGYFRGREFVRERDLTDDMVEEEDVGDILSHCIMPRAVRAVRFAGIELRHGPMLASIDCAFFAVVQEVV
jgi:hypothetical protein